jgi:hypothetical protein
MDEKEIKTFLDETIRTSGYEWDIPREVDTWRVEAFFALAKEPAVYTSGFHPEGQRVAYQWVRDWLMIENIQRILVYRNGSLHQTITVS